MNNDVLRLSPARAAHAFRAVVLDEIMVPVRIRVRAPEQYADTVAAFRKMMTMRVARSEYGI